MPSDVSPHPRDPIHHPERQKPQSRDCLQFSGSYKQGDSGGLQDQLAHAAAASGIMKTALKTCNAHSHCDRHRCPARSQVPPGPPLGLHQHAGGLHTFVLHVDSDQRARLCCFPDPLKKRDPNTSSGQDAWKRGDPCLLQLFLVSVRADHAKQK